MADLGWLRLPRGPFGLPTNPCYTSRFEYLGNPCVANRITAVSCVLACNCSYCYLSLFEVTDSQWAACSSY